jgi:hypothetical protein
VMVKVALEDHHGCRRDSQSTRNKKSRAGIL